MAYSRPLLTGRLTPQSTANAMKIESDSWSSTSSTMRIRSMSHHRGTYSTMARSAIFTSLLVEDYTRRPSRSISMMTGQCWASILPRGPTNNPTSLTSTWPPTLVLTRPSNPCWRGFTTYSPALEETSKSSSKRWLTQTIGGWQGRLPTTVNLRTILPPSPSKSINTSGTSMQHRPAWPHASCDSCSLMLLNESKHSAIYHANQGPYARDGGGAPMEHAICMCVYPRWMRTDQPGCVVDVRGCPL
jgi:hypothetical protein